MQLITTVCRALLSLMATTQLQFLSVYATPITGAANGAVNYCAKMLEPPKSAGELSYIGLNIAGFDFGCRTDGSCTAAKARSPLSQNKKGSDGLGQMRHFVENDGFNTFRLPVGWQFLTNDKENGELDSTNFAEYDALVQACLSTGASCIIDIHNYARYNGLIIGQGDPADEIFADLWLSIASRYRNDEKVMFGLMNEPHYVLDINVWAKTVQKVVFAIRSAGAFTQKILLPGNNWTSAGTFVSSGSAEALHKVVDSDGKKTNLIFDVHAYLDRDNSGTHSECVTNNIADAWAPLAQWLRCNKRQAINAETGGGNTASCVRFLCEQIVFQSRNSDVFLGYVGWAAGSFNATYILSQVPTRNGKKWIDTLLTKHCLAPIAGASS